MAGQTESPTGVRAEQTHALLPYLRAEALDDGLAVRKAVLPIEKTDHVAFLKAALVADVFGLIPVDPVTKRG